MEHWAHFQERDLYKRDRLHLNGRVTSILVDRFALATWEDVDKYDTRLGLKPIVWPISK